MVHIKTQTALEKHVAKKREMAEDLDYLRQVENLPSDQGRKFVIDTEKEKQNTEQKQRNDIKNALNTSQGLGFTYRSKLAVYAQSGLGTIDWPSGWEREAVATDGHDIRIYGKWFKSQVGVLIVVKSPKGEVYIRGIRTANEPELDVKAIDILILQAENTLDSAKGLLLSDNVDTVSGLKKTKGGILLPN